jgi:hypothetical protein
LFILLGVVGFEFKFEGKRDEPVEFDHSLFNFVILESSEMD